MTGLAICCRKSFSWNLANNPILYTFCWWVPW